MAGTRSPEPADRGTHDMGHSLGSAQETQMSILDTLNPFDVHATVPPPVVMALVDPQGIELEKHVMFPVENAAVHVIEATELPGRPVLAPEPVVPVAADPHVEATAPSRELTVTTEPAPAAPVHYDFVAKRVSMADQRQEYEMRVKQCMQTVQGIMTEAKNAGFSVGVQASLDTSGEPKVTVVVLMR